MRAEPSIVEIQRDELTYKAFFADPQFALLAAPARTLHHLFARLAPLGLRLPDIKIEGNINNLPDFVVSCSLPTNSMILKFRLETLEATAFSLAAANTVIDVLTAALSAVGDITGPSFKGLAAHEILWAAHCVLRTGTLAEYLEQYVRQSPWGNEGLGGLGFRLGANPDEARMSAHAVISPSAVISGALYFQVSAGYEGKLDLRAAQERFTSLLRHTATSLRLQTKDGAF